ncbi:MAG: glycosyltransferase [Bacteroidia bacterium]|nr:glycosyltransferase [Bacteroidia bacterium]
MFLVFLFCWGIYGYLLWRWSRWAPPSFSSGSASTVAIIIPVRNEEKNLATCLDSLLQQTYPPTEIWVIDDHSEDGTLLLAHQYAEKEPRIRVLSLPPTKWGKKEAIRLGIQHASADVILTTDGDTRHEPDTVEKMAAPFTHPAVQAVGGWVRLKAASGLLNAFQRIEVAGLLTLTAGSWKRGEPITANGALLAYRRSTFWEVDGWGPAQLHPSGDDDLLVQRIYLRYGPSSLLFSEAIVETQAAPTWEAFLQQRLRWLSKRGLYRLSFPRIGLALLALTQASLPIALWLYPLFGAIGWIGLGMWQSYIARKGLSQTRSENPPLLYWGVSVLLYPLYVVGVSLLSLLRPQFSWKGRIFSSKVLQKGELL